MRAKIPSYQPTAYRRFFVAALLAGTAAPGTIAQTTPPPQIVPAAFQKAPAALPPDTTDLRNYENIVSHYDQDISDNHRLSAADAEKYLNLFGFAAVQMPDGDVIHLDNSADLAELRRIAGTHGGSASSDTQDRIGVLAAFVRAVAGGQRKVNLDNVTRDVLSRKEFSYPPIHKKPEPTWFEKWIQRVSDSIDEFFRRLSHRDKKDTPDAGALAGLAAFLRILMISLLVVAVVGGISWVGYTWYQNGGLRRLKGGTGSKADDSLELTPEEVHDPLAAARRMAERGDTRGAVRLVYIASLRKLAAAGLLILEPNRTNWEYQSDLRARSPQIHARLLPGTQLFDRIWYGRRQASNDEFTRMLAIHDSLPDASAGPISGDAAPAHEAAQGGSR